MAYTDNFVADFLPLVEDLAGAENANFSKALFTKTFLASDITKKHTVVTGVRNGSLVPIITDQPNYEAFPFVDANSCNTEECDINATYSGVKWKLGLISCRVPICLRTFNENFLIFFNSYKMLNPAKVDRVYLKTALLQYITNLVANSLEAAKWRVEYFAEDGHWSPLLNGFDGWFAQAAAVPSLWVDIPRNAGTDYANQQMTGQEIYDLFAAMEAKYLEQEWANTLPVELRVTKKMATTLAAYLNNLKDTACCTWVERLNPDNIATKSFYYDKMAFHGIPIVPMPEWDAIINNVGVLNGGGGAAARDRPNRALLTAKTNLLIGTEERDMLSMLDIFYDKKDKKVYIDAEAYLGAAIPQREYILGI